MAYNKTFRKMARTEQKNLKEELKMEEVANTKEWKFGEVTIETRKICMYGKSEYVIHAYGGGLYTFDVFKDKDKANAKFLELKRYALCK